MVKAYIHDNKNDSDYRAPHNSGTELLLDELAKLGVIYRYCANEDEVNDIARERQYKNRDVVDIHKGSFKDKAQFNEKLAMFYKEHLHEDEEIRYCLEGTGYFDVRDASTPENWIRCLVEPGDLLILPPGIYHRFTLTTSNHIKALRLFKDEPKWQAINRSTQADSLPVRKDYISQIRRY
ncbi:YMR009W [Saccharomyces arboricola H-6]|uniref:Acireductone dioxygenase n=1 Tax=Saccharomyces arboricola (strain H-6 / AS 2.3317 / CBS 10644) TaxID=1160507 RepID=J8PYI4_SACAR|nr:YMR009W [Saccharomyces arboricola H-6]